MLLLALAALLAGVAALRVWSLLGVRMDPDLAMTEAASGLALAAQWLILAGLGLVAVLTRIARGSGPGPVTRGLALASLGLVVAGSLGVVVAETRDPARIGWLATAIGALLAVPLATHVAWLAGAAAHHTAAPTTDGSATASAPPSRGRRWPALAVAVLAVVAVIPPAVRPPESDPERVCEAAVECRSIVVRADRRSTARGATTTIEYGLRPADGARRGTLVIVAGGPGISGIVAFRLLEATLPARLLAAYDVVVLDPRGTGQSGYRGCPQATTAYAIQLDLDVEASVVTSFVDRCIAEAGVPAAELARYGSEQIVEDIEAIRRDLGVERIVLYGESYGTAMVQRYALAHPDRVAALVIDGPFDPTLPIDELWSDSAAGFEDVLDQTFEACRRDPACTTDLPEPDVAWDGVLADLRDAIRTAGYAESDGTPAIWPITDQLARRGMAEALYDGSGRMLVLRSLAAAMRDDWVPLARLVYAGRLDAEAKEATSEFVYLATWCADRVVDPPELDIAGYLAAARAALADRRLGDVVLSGAACHAWPVAPGPPPGSSLPADAGFPVVILTATADPVTPAPSARRLHERLDAMTDAYLVETTGGQHLTFGRGFACPDAVVVGLLVDGIVPASAVTTCPGSLIDPYVGIVEPVPGEDPLGFHARAFAAEVLGHPDVVGWEARYGSAIGCRHGGRFVIETLRDLGEIEFDACAVIEGRPLTGRGTIGPDGSLGFDVRFPGGTLVGDVEADGGARWSGTIDGREHEGSTP